MYNSQPQSSSTTLASRDTSPSNTTLKNDSFSQPSEPAIVSSSTPMYSRPEPMMSWTTVSENRPPEPATTQYQQPPQQHPQYTMGAHHHPVPTAGAPSTQPPSHTMDVNIKPSFYQYGPVPGSSMAPAGAIHSTSVSGTASPQPGYPLKTPIIDHPRPHDRDHHQQQQALPPPLSASSSFSGSPPAVNRPKSPFQNRMSQPPPQVVTTHPASHLASAVGPANMSPSQMPPQASPVGMMAAMAGPGSLPPLLPPQFGNASNVINEHEVIEQNPDISRSALSLKNPPPGIKPRITTTLWEDEGTLCFQVDVKGVCVARREDNNMINGTKLLNVTGMSRGRRDGILKAEKNRQVVKIGAMHFKGVWIPYERAVKFACKEKIIDRLYPLFVTDIKTLLYLPNNYARTALIMSAALRKKEENQQRQREREEMMRKKQMQDDQQRLQNPQQQQQQQQQLQPQPQMQQQQQVGHPSAPHQQQQQQQLLPPPPHMAGQQSPPQSAGTIGPTEGYMPFSSSQYYTPYGPGTPTVITPVSSTPSDQYRSNHPGYIITASQPTNAPTKPLIPSPQQQTPSHQLQPSPVAYSNYYYQGGPASGGPHSHFAQQQQQMVSGQPQYQHPSQVVGYSGGHPQQMSPILSADPSQSRSPSTASSSTAVSSHTAPSSATGPASMYPVHYFQSSSGSPPPTSFLPGAPAQMATAAVAMGSASPVSSAHGHGASAIITTSSSAAQHPVVPSAAALGTTMAMGSAPGFISTGGGQSPMLRSAQYP